jgi:cobalt-zinc-cadmium efflux system protein
MHNHAQECRGPHEHGHEVEANRKALWLAIGITVVIMIVEVVGGLLSNSLALLSDAGHMLTDVLALALSLLAVEFTTRPPSVTRTYGFYRMEILAALANGASLLFISALILYEAYRRFRATEPVDTQTMLIIAGIGLVANGAAALAMMKRSGESLNIRGAYLHILGDALSSVGVILGGLVIMLTGWYIVDPIISVIICFVIFRGAFALVKDSVNILLEAAPKGLDLGEIQMALREIPGVRDLHDLHLWTISSGIHAISAHVLVDNVPLSRGGEILQDIGGVLKERYRIEHTTIQLECENCEEGLHCDPNGVCIAVSRAHPAHHHG